MKIIWPLVLNNDSVKKPNEMWLKFRLYWFYKVLPVMMKNKILNGSLSGLNFPAKHTKGAGAAERNGYSKSLKQLKLGS